MRASNSSAPASIDAYIAGFSPQVQTILRRIRRTIAAAAPGATQIISYRMPAFTHDGVLVYFAAFKQHIGLYPPVRGDARLEAAVARYAGEKGNLQFPLDESIPYELIGRIVRFRLKQNLAKKKKTAKKKVTKKQKPRARDATRS